MIWNEVPSYLEQGSSLYGTRVHFSWNFLFCQLMIDRSFLNVFGKRCKCVGIALLNHDGFSLLYPLAVVNNRVRAWCPSWMIIG